MRFGSPLGDYFGALEMLIYLLTYLLTFSDLVNSVLHSLSCPKICTLLSLKYNVIVITAAVTAIFRNYRHLKAYKQIYIAPQKLNFNHKITFSDLVNSVLHKLSQDKYIFIRIIHRIQFFFMLFSNLSKIV